MNETHEIESRPTPQISARVHVVDDDDYEFADRIDATWRTWEWDDEKRWGYWLVCGDNTGSQQLVVHPYMIPALIELLHRCQDETPEAS